MDSCSTVFPSQARHFPLIDLHRSCFAVSVVPKTAPAPLLGFEHQSPLHRGAGKWATEVRTPLGLIPEGNNTFTLFYTGGIKPNPIYSESVGFVTLKLKDVRSAPGTGSSKKWM